MRLALIVVVFAAVAGCAPTEAAGPVAPPERPASTQAVHDVMDDYLQAATEQDWERVHALTADSARPNNRKAWLEGRPDGFVDKCAGDPAGRPAVDVHVVEGGRDRFLVQSTVWVQSNQGLTCRYEVLLEDGRWRVGTNVPRVATS